MKTIIQTNNAPAAIGPYSQAVRVGNLIFCSGMIPIDPESGQVVNENIEMETHRVMNNIKALLEAAGSDLSKIVKTSIFMTDMNNYAKINTVYASYFVSEFPAREAVQVSRLPKDVNVEISVIAMV